MTDTGSPTPPPTVGGRTFDPEFLATRQGQQFVLYAGLLDAAHKSGRLRGITTTLVQTPSDLNDMTCIVYAQVSMGEGVDEVFTGLGDANPKNVNQQMIPHLIRLAETRAKARALRDAVNVKGELLDDQQTFGAAAQPSQPSQPPQAPVVEQPSGRGTYAPSGTGGSSGTYTRTPPPDPRRGTAR
jgi:hypothetical protein